MNEMNYDKCGTFIAGLRKELGYTQKELAEKLMLSDKAVSKWERGLSMPDISILMPLAKVLGVTVTEILQGERTKEPVSISPSTVEELLTKTIMLSAKEEPIVRAQKRKRRAAVYIACVFVALLEIFILSLLGYSNETLFADLFLVEFLMLLFGSWFCLFIKEMLPGFYDEHHIGFYTDGIFRLNIAGMRFNNSNWPHILRAGRVTTLSVAVLFPILYGILSWYFPRIWESYKLVITLASAFAIFIPIIIVGKKYE
ncbi:MAG: helix-turn-helix transcriptional regulator [Firmicutes bacterium]|nr:helix-turn-helix transcriptional regulator [Bacillota bacterium]